MTTPVLTIQNLTTIIQGQRVHQHLNMSVNRGEIFAIVGKSGTGKTTLLRQILSLDTPHSGTIELFGEKLHQISPNKLRQLQRRYGVLFQQGALFSSLTTLENIAFPLEAYTKLNLPTRKKLALLKLKLVGLNEETADKYPSQLSGGMLKRVSLARACIMDPEILFLDEPASGLDPESIESFDQLILTLRENLNLTIIMVTHDIESLRRTADRIAYLGEGHVLACGNMSELVESKNPEVLRFFRVLK